MRIGDTAPRFRVSALCQGRVRYVDAEHFRGRWTCLTFLPALQGLDAEFVERQAEALACQDLLPLVVEPHDAPHQLWRYGLQLSHVTILADPIGRLHRRFGLKRASGTKCRSFLIDPDRVIRFQLIHDLTASGMTATVQVFQACRSLTGVLEGCQR